MYKISFLEDFVRDLRALTVAQKQEVLEVISMLQDDGELPEEYKTHVLKGKLAGLLDSHIDDDLILLWSKNRKNITLYRLGTHAVLFK